MKQLKSPEEILETQLYPTEVEDNKTIATIGLLSSRNAFAPLLLSLNDIEKFVTDSIAVLVQRGLGVEHAISDYHFTEHGADIMEDELPIIAMSNIVLKYMSFSVEEIFFLKPKQIIISNAYPECFSKEIIHFLNEKRITAVGINFINIAPLQIQRVMRQLISVLIFPNKLQHTIQLNPMLLKSVYCYKGEICNIDIAEHAGVPWKDLAELCWNWN